MKLRSRRRVVWISAALAVLVALVCWQRYRRNGSWWLEHRISALIEKSATRPFRMADATDFAWDSLYVFMPYTADSEVERRLGVPWQPAHQVRISQRDDAVLLVFKHGQEVVGHVVQPDKPGDFGYVPSNVVYTPDTAVFQVTQRDGWRCVEVVASSRTPSELRR